jgi:hypothetical protein
MEGVLVTLLNERGLAPTDENYLKLLSELNWRPRITELSASPAAKPPTLSPA